MKQLVFERYAIFQTGGKQYQAIEGKTVAIEKLDIQDGEEVEFPEVLLRKSQEGAVEVGRPFLGTPVKGIVVKHDKAPKVIVHKFKRRKGYSVTKGHRQPFTIVRVTAI